MACHVDQRRVASLGVFDFVRVKLIDEQRPSELKDLVAEVSERDRQPIEIVPGISTAEGPRLQLSYSHINVLGRAWQFTALAKVNRQIFFQLSFNKNRLIMLLQVQLSLTASFR